MVTPYNLTIMKVKMANKKNLSHFSCFILQKKGYHISMNPLPFSFGHNINEIMTKMRKAFLKCERLSLKFSKVKVNHCGLVVLLSVSSLRQGL